jgi:hypothetical protein
MYGIYSNSKKNALNVSKLKSKIFSLKVKNKLRKYMNNKDYSSLKKYIDELNEKIVFMLENVFYFLKKRNYTMINQLKRI